MGREYDEALAALRIAEAKLDELTRSMTPVVQEVERLRLRCRELGEHGPDKTNNPPVPRWKLVAPGTWD